MKYNQNISVIYSAGFEFPIEERHYRIGIELAMSGCLHHLHFIDNPGVLVNDQPINALTLITEVLTFDRIFRVGRRDRVLFEFWIDRNDVGSTTRHHKRDLEQ